MDIDVIMNDAELAKMTDDNSYAINKFSEVISKCAQFPAKTMKRVISATYSLAKCILDTDTPWDAQPHLKIASYLLCDKIN
jgi:hypothetical protein